MANQWLRLWHDMPNDPKWRTIARHSKQPISLVQATFIHLLVDASRNVTRGHADVTAEDLASALDCEEEQIQAILDAMQGRVLHDMEISGWEKRQPRREDSSDVESSAKSAAERKRAQREREKTGAGEGLSRDVTATSRDVTLDKDKDKDKEEERGTSSSLRSEEGSAASATTPTPAKPNREKRAQRTLAVFLADCKAQSVKPVPDDHAIRRWAADAGITDEMLQVAWLAFRERYVDDANNRGKRYKDWAATFANSVKDNWFGLWFTSEAEGVQWATKGLTRKQALDANRAAREKPREQEAGHVVV
ncbi:MULTISPECIES: hypothetical protein [unclassified Acidovorax]|uniref:hypothetical protein n=1 Tax=unclassified Acidovorax TaxID=2684926 RepID=UPI0028830CFB|nr:MULTISPECIES: hypothetical protein [unclassified Acidovorax]